MISYSSAFSEESSYNERIFDLRRYLSLSPLASLVGPLLEEL